MLSMMLPVQHPHPQMFQSGSQYQLTRCVAMMFPVHHSHHHQQHQHKTITLYAVQVHSIQQCFHKFRNWGPVQNYTQSNGASSSFLSKHIKQYYISSWTSPPKPPVVYVQFYRIDGHSAIRGAPTLTCHPRQPLVAVHLRA